MSSASSTSSSTPAAATPSVTSQLTAVASREVDEDWEEWNPREPFSVHMVAGSFAGLREHALIYPLDTVKTFIQVSAASSVTDGAATAGVVGAGAAAVRARATKAAAKQRVRNLVRQHGPTRMFRGVGTM